MESPSQLWKQIEAKSRVISHWQSINTLLMWDQETYLPLKGNADRSDQLALVSGHLHHLITDGFLEESLVNLEKDEESSTIVKKQAEIWLRDIRRRKKLSQSFVEKLSKKTSLTLASWEESRAENSGKAFNAQFSELIELKKEEAELIGYHFHPYDALLQEYETDFYTSDLRQLFQNLSSKLTALDQKIRPQYPTNSKAASFEWSNKKQWDFSLDLIKRIGFDFKRGRQDISTHPFTIRIGAHDVRMTTRIQDNHIGEMIWSCLHEAGHGIYEQGLNANAYGLPLGEAASLSVHESQSRLWENCIGRGSAFIHFLKKLLDGADSKRWNPLSTLDLFTEANRLNDSLVRTQSDELRYHQHIAIRFELECQLMKGELSVSNLEEAWNESYFRDFGRYPQMLTEGYLQDVHWAHGSIGYFPTYSLGSIMASQLYAQMKQENPNFTHLIEEGNFQFIHAWLGKHVFSSGRLRSLRELCHDICGEPLNSDYLIADLNEKYSLILDLHA